MRGQFKGVLTDLYGVLTLSLSLVDARQGQALLDGLPHLPLSSVVLEQLCVGLQAIGTHTGRVLPAFQRQMRSLLLIQVAFSRGQVGIGGFSSVAQLLPRPAHTLVKFGIVWRECDGLLVRLQRGFQLTCAGVGQP